LHVMNIILYPVEKITKLQSTLPKEVNLNLSDKLNVKFHISAHRLMF